MAIDPKLVSIIPASQLPTGDPTSAADFLFYEGDALKKGSMSNIYDKVTSGIKGVATQTNAPTVYTAEEYPDGLFERYIVHDPLTAPNSWSNIVVTAADLDIVNGVANNEVILEVNNGVATKRVTRKMGPEGLPGADYTATIQPPLNPGFYIKTSVSPINQTPVASASYVYTVVDVSEGDIFNIKGSGGVSGRLWAIAKADGTIISNAPEDFTYPDYTALIMPSEAKKLYVNFSTINPNYGIYKDSLLKQVGTIKTDLLNSKISQTYTTANARSGSFYPTNGATVGARTGNSAYENMVFDVEKGDTFIIKGVGGISPRLWAIADDAGNIIRKSSDEENKGLVDSKIYIENTTAKKMYVNNNIGQEFYIIKVNGDAVKKTNAFTTSKNEIYIAASDSSDMDKLNADVVCTGINDEIMINAAINSLVKGGKIYMYAGIYNVDAFTNRNDEYGHSGIFVANTGKNRMVEIIGLVKPQILIGQNCAKIKVSQACWAGLAIDTERSLIRGENSFLGNVYMRPSSLIVKDIILEIPDNSKAINMIDYRCLTTGGMEGVLMKAETSFQNTYYGSGRPPIAHLKCVGYKGFIQNQPLHH